jgi:hypothetical protein
VYSAIPVFVTRMSPSVGVLRALTVKVPADAAAELAPPCLWFLVATVLAEVHAAAPNPTIVTTAAPRNRLGRRHRPALPMHGYTDDDPVDVQETLDRGAFG